MGKLLVALPPRRLEGKGKPQALASFPGVQLCWCSLGRTNELPVSPGTCTYPASSSSAPLRSAVQENPAFWTGDCGCGHLALFGVSSPLCTKMVLFTVRDRLGERGTCEAQKQTKKKKKGAGRGTGRSLWGREVKFSCSTEGEQGSRTIHLVHCGKPPWEGWAVCSSQQQ